MIEDIRNDKEAFKRTQEPGLYAYNTKPKMGHGYSQSKEKQNIRI